MVTKRLLSLGLGVAIASLSAGMANAATPNSSSQVSPDTGLIQSTQVAQLFYPPATLEQQVLMVVGHGQVTRPADTAQVSLILLNYDPATTDPYAQPAPNNPEAAATPPERNPLTKAMLKPVLEALVAAGVRANAIKTTLAEEASSTSPYSYYGKGSAEVTFDLDQPTRDRIVTLMTAVENAVGKGLYLQDRYVTYKTDSCANLEQEAYTAAVSDARDRAKTLAAAMGVELNNVPSVAESASIFPGFPANPYPSSCDLAVLPAAAAYTGVSYYDPDAPAEVSLQRDLYVTYPIRRR
ncbi:MAG TPA: SIMPL domain-containing protein [Coleofasciculaceae cyanobacterium]